MHFVAALDRVPGVRCVLGLAETVVTGCADGYGRKAEHPAATLLHCEPGLGNGLANLHNARRACTRIVNIVDDHGDADLLDEEIQALGRRLRDERLLTTSASARRRRRSRLGEARARHRGGRHRARRTGQQRGDQHPQAADAQNGASHERQCRRRLFEDDTRRP